MSGICEERDLVEIIEITEHPWFVGVQFHPEFKSKPLAPHPLFRRFVAASLDHKRKSFEKTKSAKSSTGRKLARSQSSMMKV